MDIRFCAEEQVVGVFELIMEARLFNPEEDQVCTLFMLVGGECENSFCYSEFITLRRTPHDFPVEFFLYANHYVACITVKDITHPLDYEDFVHYLHEAQLDISWHMADKRYEQYVEIFSDASYRLEAEMYQWNSSPTVFTTMSIC